MVSEEESLDSGLRALSDTTRRGILVLLQEEQLSVLEIAERFPMSRPAISKHLRILREAGLVEETPAGRQRLYSLDPSPLELLQRWLVSLDGRGRPASRGRGQVSPRKAGPRGGKLTEQADWRVW